MTARTFLAFVLILLVALASGVFWARPGPVAAAGVTDLAAGGAHTCAVTAAGGVQCWGLNTFGQLGDGTTIQRTSPVNVSGLGSGVAAIAAGAVHTCALTTTGSVKCWGYNGWGQLGDGTTTDRTTPVNVSGLGGGITSISAGGFHTCALTTAGGIKCWGNNVFGQLGDGTDTSRATPAAVSGLTSGVAAIGAGLWHTCALATASGARCWGNGLFGTLGNGFFETESTVPVDVCQQFDEQAQQCVLTLSGVTAMATGGRHTCALTSTGGAKCWGANEERQLGDGTTIDSATPVDVSSLTSGVAGLAAGGLHTCGLTTTRGAKCWGYNFSGQLGDGTTTHRVTPVNVSGLASGVASVVTGSWHSCALTASALVKCWGRNNNGQLGDGTTVQRSAPVDVVGLGGEPVGGIAELPQIEGAALEASDSSGGNALSLAGLVAAAMAGSATLGGAAWYVRRHWVRR